MILNLHFYAAESFYNSSSLLYKWTYPNDSAIQNHVTHYTRSPLIQLQPRCNSTFYSTGTDCILTVSVLSQNDVTSYDDVTEDKVINDGVIGAIFNVSMGGRLQRYSSHYPSIQTLGEPSSFAANCSGYDQPGECCSGDGVTYILPFVLLTCIRALVGQENKTYSTTV